MMLEVFKIIMATIVGVILINEGRISICKSGKKSGFVKFMGGVMILFGVLTLINVAHALI